MHINIVGKSKAGLYRHHRS